MREKTPLTPAAARNAFIAKVQVHRSHENGAEARESYAGLRLPDDAPTEAMTTWFFAQICAH